MKASMDTESRENYDRKRSQMKGLIRTHKTFDKGFEIGPGES